MQRRQHCLGTRHAGLDLAQSAGQLAPLPIALLLDLAMAEAPAAAAQSEKKSETMHTSGKLDVADRMRRVMEHRQWRVAQGVQPFRFHSHCAGADAPTYALKALGVPFELAAASEIDSAVALLHLRNHSATHLFSDIKYAAQGGGPCYTHKGKFCQVDTAGKLDCLVASFVCTPWSQNNPKRHKADPCVAMGENAAVDTYYHTRRAIQLLEPSYFVLENVDGVGQPRSKSMKTSPLDFMLDDPAHGLRSIKDKDDKTAYSVEPVQHVPGKDGGAPQDRHRTLFFGAHSRTGKSGQAVARRFEKFLSSSAKLGVYHLDTFLNAEQAGAQMDSVDEDAVVDDKIAYLQELSKALSARRASKAPASELKLPPEAERPSVSAVTTARMKAIIDVAQPMAKRKLEEFVKSGGDESAAHPLADVSCSIERLPIHVDGTLPTLTTGATIWSYKKSSFLEPQDLFASMGYPRSAHLDFLSLAARRKLVGNGYVVSVSACAMAAICSFTGHLVKAADDKSADDK